MKKLLLLITLSAFAFVWACESPIGNGCNPDPPSTEITVTGPISSDVGIGHPWMTAWEDLSKRGYVEEEFFFEGQATSYEVDGAMTADGLWAVSQADKAPYKTRLVVRRPADASKFNGTVVVEWFNVSGGVDAGPAWMFLEPFLTREGYIWVGVSAQQVGVQGGGFSMLGNAVQPLTKWDPERYGSLVHPGDPYSYDMYSQAARVIKGEGSRDVLGGMKAERLLAYGESQSAGTMITYTDAVQPLAKVFDGIFIHSRGSVGHPLTATESAGCGLPTMTLEDEGGLKVRTDLEVPVMQFETETDVAMMSFYSSRQPDTDLIRSWEVAGTAHADYYLASRITEAEIPENVPFGAEMFTCESGNKGPQYIVLRAALKSLDRWVKDGIAPPKAEPLEMEGAALVRDEHGNAKGGIRTPDVDVPVSTLKPIPAFDGSGGCGGGQTADGEFDRTGMMCMVFGGTAPFPEDKLLDLYPTHEDYIAKFTASAQATVAAGFMLEEEAAAIIAEAQAAAIPN